MPAQTLQPSCSQYYTVFYIFRNEMNFPPNSYGGNDRVSEPNVQLFSFAVFFVKKNHLKFMTFKARNGQRQLLHFTQSGILIQFTAILHISNNVEAKFCISFEVLRHIYNSTASAMCILQNKATTDSLTCFQLQNFQIFTIHTTKTVTHKLYGGWRIILQLLTTNSAL